MRWCSVLYVSILPTYIIKTLIQHILEGFTDEINEKRVFNTKECTYLRMIHPSNNIHVHVCTID